MSDDSGVGDVDWDHGFLHGRIKHDLSRFGVTKDIEFCILVRASAGGDLDQKEGIHPQLHRGYQYQLLRP